MLPAEERPALRTIFTIGHSTRAWDELRSILEDPSVRRVVDVRKIPRSRRNPQFDQEAFAASVRGVGWMYEHEPRLGGLRSPDPDSPNVGWRNRSFRGYADYMRTREFHAGLQELVDSSRRVATAVLCAEALPARCHRRLIADALVVRGWTVVHLLGGGRTWVHDVTPGAQMVGADLVYTGASGASHSLDEFGDGAAPAESRRMDPPRSVD